MTFLFKTDTFCGDTGKTQQLQSGEGLTYGLSSAGARVAELQPISVPLVCCVTPGERAVLQFLSPHCSDLGYMSDFIRERCAELPKMMHPFAPTRECWCSCVGVSF